MISIKPSRTLLIHLLALASLLALFAPTRPSYGQSRPLLILFRIFLGVLTVCGAVVQAQNAGLFLGQIPNPATGEKSVNLRAAKSVIDSLGMLKAKTAGNLTETEEKLLEMALKNLLPLYKTALNESES